MKKALGNGPDAADVESLRVTIDELTEKLEDAENKAAELQAKLNEQAAKEEPLAEEQAAAE